MDLKQWLTLGISFLIGNSLREMLLSNISPSNTEMTALRGLSLSLEHRSFRSIEKRSEDLSKVGSSELETAKAYVLEIVHHLEVLSKITPQSSTRKNKS